MKEELEAGRTAHKLLIKEKVKETYLPGLRDRHNLMKQLIKSRLCSLASSQGHQEVWGIMCGMEGLTNDQIG